MKLFSFPLAALERAVNKRILTLDGADRDWFSARWQQKPYQKHFLEKKAMPLVIFIAKGKNWTDAEFQAELADWNETFHPAEVQVLRPMIEGEGLIQLMQKKVPPDRIQALHAKLDQFLAAPPQAD